MASVSATSQTSASPAAPLQRGIVKMVGEKKKKNLDMWTSELTTWMQGFLLISSVSRRGWRCCVQNRLPPVLQLKTELVQQLIPNFPCWHRVTRDWHSGAAHLLPAVACRANTSWFCMKSASPLPNLGLSEVSTCAMLLLRQLHNKACVFFFLKKTELSKVRSAEKTCFFSRANNKANRIAASFGNLGGVNVNRCWVSQLIAG